MQIYSGANGTKLLLCESMYNLRNLIKLEYGRCLNIDQQTRINLHIRGPRNISFETVNLNRSPHVSSLRSN